MKQFLIAGLLVGMAGLGANAQMTPNDPMQQSPSAQTPGTPPTFPTDRQDTTQQNRRDTDADTQQTDRDRQSHADRDRLPQSDRDDQDQQAAPADRDRNAYPQSDRDRDSHVPQADRDRDSQNPQDRNDQMQQRPGRDYDRDRNTGSVGTRIDDRDHGGGSEYQSRLQNALQQQPNLSGVRANYTDSAVELTGTVATGKDKHQARMLAENYANGRQVVDHIAVTGKGKNQ